jgi:preprotein translocase SecF subunit
MKLLKLVPDHTDIHFIELRPYTYVISALLVFGSIALFLFNGLNYGIDFKGGVMIEIATEKPVELGPLRSGLDKLGLGDVSIQTFGEPRNLLLRFRGTTEQASNTKPVDLVKAKLAELVPGKIDYRRVETVGGKVGSELIVSGVMGLLLSMAAVVVYIWFRFEWQFGVAAIIALIHDVVSTIGLFALLGLEFNLTIIAALLTIVGYSLNDTVVVFDRARENLRKFRKMPLPELLNLTVNETLSRTIMTSGMTMTALLALLFFGGDVVRGFTIAMIWGIVTGTYSSIYVASPILLFTNIRREAEAVEVRP